MLYFLLCRQQSARLRTRFQRRLSVRRPLLWETLCGSHVPLYRLLFASTVFTTDPAAFPPNCGMAYTYFPHSVGKHCARLPATSADCVWHLGELNPKKVGVFRNTQSGWRRERDILPATATHVQAASWTHRNLFFFRSFTGFSLMVQ